MSCEREALAIGGVQILTFLSIFMHNSNFLPVYPSQRRVPLLVDYIFEVSLFLKWKSADFEGFIKQPKRQKKHEILLLACFAELHIGPASIASNGVDGGGG